MEEESKSKKKNKQKKDNTIKPSLPENLDDMDFLDAMISENKRCGLHTCMTNIELFHCTCKSCHRRFCAVHFYENLHNCEFIGKA
jgi:hypothetical protein